MRLETVAPSFVFFLSGVAASVAVNLLTALPTGSTGTLSRTYLIAGAVLWLCASWFLTQTGAVIEETRRRAEALSSVHLSDVERLDILQGQFASIRNKVILLSLLAACAAVGGTVFLWN